jgi:hypothetical protein
VSQELKPCPFCASTRLSNECTGAAEISGHTYQTGWIECLDCGCDGPSVDLTDETPAQNDYQLVRDAWNRRAAIAAPPGWVLMPAEPTQKMRTAAQAWTDSPTSVYRAMLAAAPDATTTQSHP